MFGVHLTATVANPMTHSSDIAGCFALYFSCSIAAAGGIGGGGLNLPILLYIIKKDYRYVESITFQIFTKSYYYIVMLWYCHYALYLVIILLKRH